MSFTTEIKRELVRSVPRTREEGLALLQAILFCCGTERESGFSFVSENESVAAYVIGIFEGVGICTTLTEAVRDPKHDRDKLTFSYTGEDAAARLFEIASVPIRSDGCAHAYLKGAFLGGGSCVLPRGENKSGYHLEFVFPRLADAERLLAASERFHLLCGLIERGEKYVAYCKNREGIADYLSVLGAENALRTLERTAAARDESNNRNRLENCMAGNIDRSMTASARQIRFLSSLQEAELLSLPPDLRETAAARIHNPTLSYSELAALLGISRSSLQRRLDKLMSLQGEKP